MKIVLGLLLLLMNSGAAFAEKIDLREFNATYDVYRSGMKIAKMKRSFSRMTDGNLLYHSETKVTGLASLFRNDKIIEKSIWQYENGQVIPRMYEYLHTGIKNERNVTVEFDWEANQIINSVNGDSWKMPAEAGMLDKLLYQLCIMLDLRAGKSDLSYTVADGGREKTYLFETLGEEVIDTPLGDLRTVKIKRYRMDSDRVSIVWSAPEMGYFPVRFEDIDDGEKTVVVIDSLSGPVFDPPVETETAAQTAQTKATSTVPIPAGSVN